MGISPRALKILAALAIIILALTGVVFLVAKHYERNAREQVIAALKKQFNGDVTLGSLQVSLFPGVRATGDGLVVRFAGRTDVPPLIVVKQFRVSASLAGLLRSPLHIGRVDLSGLEIHIPPKQDGARAPGKPSHADFVVDEANADGAVLEILPRDEKKTTPLRFGLKRLHLESAGTDGAMSFQTEFTNALPPGLIQSAGRMGPWSAKEPGDTPVSGHYTFRNADLSVFKGIRGTLASDGKYQGEIGNIEVQGTADVLNFALKAAGNAVPLRTSFAATVNGTDGDTYLHPVKALLGAAQFEVSGSVANDALVKGKEIDLTTKAESAPLQDFLRLAVRGPEPPMTGSVSLDSKLKITPGTAPIFEKLQLDGKFEATTVKFTSADVQDKIAGLSHRAEGNPKDHNPNVPAAMRGRFLLDNGTMKLSGLAFDLPGARIGLEGTYVIASGAIDFRGQARLDATVSQMTTGIKSVLLKPVDPLFRHDGAGAVVPIVISGTRGSPSFRLDIGRAIRAK